MNNELNKRIISSIILFPLSLFFIINGSFYFNFLLVIIFFISAYEWHNLSKYKKYHYIGYFFLLISLSFVYKLRNNFNDDYRPFLIGLFICVMTDIGGYLFGKLFRGPKLSKLSPNKTYSGLFGSFILPIFTTYFLIKLFYDNKVDILIFVLFVTIISLISQIGDLIISFFKRKSKIKDTGKIIPGHGGLLDRIDGMLFALPAFYIFLLLKFIEL